MDDNEKKLLEAYNKKNKRNRQLLTTVKIDNGTEYALFTNGDICEILKNGEFKKVNHIIDKDNKLKNKILERFNDTHSMDVIYSNNSLESIEPNDVKSEIEVELPEL